MLQNQMRLIAASDIPLLAANKNHYKNSTVIISNVGNGNIDRYVCHATAKLMKAQKCRKVIWRTSRDHEEQPFVLFVQRFSNKPVTSLGSIGNYIYDLLMKLLKI